MSATAPEGEEVCCGSRKVTSWRVVTNVSHFGFFVFGAVGISMNLGNVLASMGSSYAGLCKRGRPGRFKCGLLAPILLVLGDGVLLCFPELQLLRPSDVHH